MKRKLMLSVYLISVFFALSAQVKIHKHITVEDGLVQSQVASILEDSSGYLWFGTFGGVSRWNGHDFKNYRTQDGLVGGRVVAMVQNKNGDIYFGIDGGGVNVFRKGKMDTISINQKFAGKSVTSLYLDKFNVLYIGTFGDGIYKYVIDAKSTEKQVVQLSTKGGLKSNNVWAIAEGRPGELLIGYDGGGLDIFKDGKITNYGTKVGLAGNIVRSIYVSKAGRIFIGFKDDGLSTFKNGKWTNYSKKDGLTGNTVWAINEGIDGTVYLSTENGVTEYKDGELSKIETKNGLSSSEIYSAYTLKNGTIFFGTSSTGIDIYEPGKLYNYFDKLSKIPVLGITEGNAGEFYFATYGKGVFVLKDGAIEPIKQKGKNKLNNSMVWSVSKGKNGKIFFATSDGFNIYQKENFVSFKSADGLLAPKVYSVLEASDGNIYIGTRKGVNVLRNGKITVLDNPLVQNTIIWSIRESKDGNIYFCADGNGLVRLKDGKLSAIQKKDGLSGDYVISSYTASDGSLLIGTDGNGLNIFKDGKFEILDAKSGLSDNTIYSILEDKFGNIYLTTNNGVNIIQTIDGKRIIRTLTKLDGISSNEHNLGSAFIDKENKIWFGTLNGVSVYDPEKDLKNMLPPRTVISQMRLFENPVEIKKEMTFKYDENYFKFDYVGIELSSPEHVTYRYKLSGVDKDWVYSSERFVQYTNLNSGSYNFQVQSANQWRVWSPSAEMNFSVKAAWWTTWWFILFAVALLGSVVSYLIYYRVHQLLAVERLRTKIAADLHDNIGSSLTEVFYLSEVGQTLVHQNKLVMATDNFNKIGQMSRGLVKSMSDIVWLVNPSKDSLYDLIIRLKDSYEDLFAHEGVNFVAENIKQLESVKLKMEYRQHLFLLFKEAINNSLKYSHCKNITLKVNKSGKTLTMILKDDGNGFDLRAPHIGNGLKNMHHRAELIKGDFRIISETDSGTEIRFTGKI